MNKKGKSVDNWESLLKSAQESFHRELKEFRRLVKIWRENQAQVKQSNNQGDILSKYAYYLEEANHSDRLKGPSFIKPIKYQQHMKNIKSQKEIFLGINFLQQKPWKVHFNKLFVQKLKLLSEQDIINIFFKIYLLHEGYINFNEGKINSLKPFEKASKWVDHYYTSEIMIDGDICFLMVSIGVHRIPHYDFNAGEQAKVEWFEHALTIAYEDLINSSAFYNQKKMKNLIDSIEASYEQSPRLNYQKQNLHLSQQEMNEKTIYFHSKKRDNRENTVKIYPTIYKKYVPDQLNNENYRFMIEKFKEYQVRSEYILFVKQTKEEKIVAIQNEEDEEQIYQELSIETAKNKKIQFKNHSKILDNLKKIPNFKYNLTNQQREVLCRDGNLIIVGRSGTGKTTCAMLRMYGIQFVVKLNEFSSLKKQGKVKQSQQKCMMILLDEIKVMKNIFLTFSGRLIDEIKKQYDDMIYQIKQKHAGSCQICKQTFKSNKVEDQEQDPLDKIKRQEEEQEKKVIALDSIRTDDFPGFFTIQNFIRIVDKTIARPFFCHQKNQNKANQINSVIKHAFINRYQYKQKEIILTDRSEAVYVDFNFFVNQVWESLPKQLTKSSKEYCLLTPSIVWAQIFSIIKGSLKSYLCPGGFISLKMYIQDHQSVFQKQGQKMFEYKQRVYKIFKSYMNWCRNEQNAYDLMDAVNHILKEIQFYGYSGPKINYMFIDQVQDLTTLTIFLISKMVINNVFYCGDTAQAITKGVSFRFEDIKFIFNQEYCKNALNLDPPEDIIYLTVNFRSHNFILQLANSVVQSIQNLFPTSINKIKKQKSDLLGPKPYIILNQPKQLLFYLICGPTEEIDEQDINGQTNLRDIIIESEKREREKIQQRKKKNKNKRKQMLMSQFEENQIDQSDEEQETQTRKFNSQQIIIVRNLQEKKKLPSSLKRGIVLTPENAKGLQFDEVILYNFFSSCPIYQKWNALLQHLEPEFTYQSQKEFEDQLSRRNKQEKQINEPLTQQAKLLLGYDPQKKSYKVWSLKAKDSLKGITVNLYHQLASQLKILYTVITRARSVFVIFDQKIPKNLLNLWKELGLAVVVDDDNVHQCHSQVYQYVKVQQVHTKYINEDSHWFKAGSQMLARKDYENAKKCFQNIKRYDLVDRINALEMEIKAQNQLYRITNGLKNLDNLSREDRKISKIKLQKEKKQTLKLYSNAGRIYQKHKRYNDAAEAFFKAEQYESSLKYYKEVEKVDRVAVCCKKLKRYKQAISYFQQTNDIDGMIGCYMEEKNWNELFNLLINNKEYINQIPELNNIAINCIKHILNQTINSQKVKRWEDYHNNFFGKDMKQSLLKKRIYSQAENSSQIKKITLEAEYLNLKNLQNKLDKERLKYQKLKETYHGLKAKLQLLCEKQEQVLKKYDQFNAKRDDSSKKMQNIRQKLCLQEMKYPPEQLESSKKYKSLSIEFAQLQEQRKQIYKQNLVIQEELNTIHDSMISLEPLEQSARIQFQQFGNRYDYKKTELGLSFLARRLKQVINQYLQQSKKILAKQQKKPIPNKAQNSRDEDFDMVSVSDISQMTDVWEEHQNIGGLHLFPRQKEELVNEISQKLNIASNLVQTQLQDNYPPFHHKYMEQRLFKHLVQISTSQKYQSLMRIKKCNKVQENKVCLLLCDYQKEFICISPKYILGYLLENSQNFRSNRQFSNQIYQIKLSHQQQKQSEEQYKELDFGERFLASLNNDGLKHKIPRLSFENKFYYQSIVSQIAFGLILQGYFKQALLLSQPGPACRIAYLFSSYEKLTYYIQEIANQFKLRNHFNHKFLFTQDQRILHYYPQASVLNIFSIQNIFYAYDECQDTPFLSKKKTPKQIDIELELVQRYINKEADKRIAIMESQRQNYLKQINRLKDEIIYYQYCLKQQIYAKEMSDRVYVKQKKKLKEQLNQLEKNQKELKEQMKELQTRQAKLLYEQEKASIPKGKKIEYQNSLNQLLFKIDSLKRQGKILDSQKLRKKRMQIDQQYKYRRIQQKQAFQAHQKIKLRVREKQANLDSLYYKMREIHKQIQQYQQSIKSLSAQQIHKYYSQFIIQNKAKIQYLYRMISIQLEIKDKQKQKQAVVKLLMRQEQQRRHKQQIELLTEENMKNIQKNSNIPKTDHFKFLTLYMKGQLSMKNKKRQTTYKNIYDVYQKIIYDGIQIENLEKKKQNKQIDNIKICNVIIFYLSYICNASYRQDIGDFIGRSIQIYVENYQKRQQIQQSKHQVETNIEYCKMKLQSIPDKLKVKANRDYSNFSYHLQNYLAKLHEYQQMLSELVGFKDNPQQLLHRFLETIYKKIKTLSVQQMHFMELLFGFFQCRIIRDCEILDFLANEYVLVRQNSIVVQQLMKLQSHKHVFAYYFDQQNTTILCRFEDVQKVILGFIQQKHQDLYKSIYSLAQKQLSQKNKMKYMDQEILGYKRNEETLENRNLLEFTQFIHHQNLSQYRNIKYYYDKMFIGDSMMKEIKQYKREALEYLLNHKHNNSDHYYFASHQIRQYYFLQKLMANMKTFNYQILKEANKKKELLRNQFQKFMKAK